MVFKTWLSSSLKIVPAKKTIVWRSLLKRIKATNPAPIAYGERLEIANILPIKSPFGYSTNVIFNGIHCRLLKSSCFVLIRSSPGEAIFKRRLSFPEIVVYRERRRFNRSRRHTVVNDKMSPTMSSALTFKIVSECKTTKARTSLMCLPHHNVKTPVFMPVGTKGSLKGLLPDQLENMDCQIMLGNTYHLGTKPGPELLKKAGGLHKFIGWNRALLTDSGGFQMVSLLKFAEINEQGVNFKSPYDGSSCLLTPEHSIEIQNAIGADIIMQLDDVVSVLTTGPRVEEAMHRTARWLDRCLAAHQRPEDQSIFPIVQGGLDPELRKQCVKELTKRDVNGFAVGGLSGGEAKDDFWRVVSLCSDLLPRNKPRYCMGVGFAVDLVVCVALGIDMFDCVYPTRTARFGCGLVDSGQINLKNKKYAKDFRPIQDDCECTTCKTYTRAYIHSIVTIETVACHLLSVHNVYYQLKLMKSMRESIKERKFPEFVKNFMSKMFTETEVPTWVKEALASVNIVL